MQICTNNVDNDDGSSRTFRVKFSDVRALCVFIFLVRSLLVQAYVFVRINICTTKFWKWEREKFAVYTIMTIMLFA